MSPSADFPESIRLISEGASSFVYEGRDELGQPIAVKVARSAEFDQSIAREIQAASDLKHEALLEILDGGENEEGRSWLSMPLLTGQTLASWNPPILELLQALSPIADLLDLMHERGWGHADLKSENILLDARSPKPQLVLSDLGFICPLGRVAGGGSPAFLSPHRLAGGVLRREDDLHAFGVLVFESVCGRLPWAEVSGELLLKSIRDGSIIAPSVIRSELPLAMDELFAELFSSGPGSGSAMGWLDTVRSLFGLDLPMRSLFLSAAPDAPPSTFSNREEIRIWVAAQIRCSTSMDASPNHEVTRTLEDLMGGDPEQLMAILVWLIEERLLRWKNGLASFDRPARDIRSLWMENRHDSTEHLAPLEASAFSILTRYGASLRLDDLVSWLEVRTEDVATALASLRKMSLVTENEDDLWRSTMTVSDLDLNALSPPKDHVLDKLWSRNSDQPAQRARLLILAASSGVGSWVGSLDQEELIALGNTLPDELVDDVESASESQGQVPVFRVPIGILRLFRELRADRLEEAVHVFWGIEAELSLEASGELNRVLVYHLAAHGRLREANDFLGRWKNGRLDQLPGTHLEIKVAARDISILSRIGELDRAASLGRDYLERFEGRPGLWSLNMALANLAADNMDRPERVKQTELALAGLRREGSGGEATELGLLIFLMGGVILWGDPDRIDSIGSIRERAGSLARGFDEVVNQQQFLAEDALLAQFRGEAVRAQHLLSKVLESARRTGELRRARFAELQLFAAYRDQGDYRSCATWMESFAESADETDDVLNILLARELVIEWCLIRGDLAAAEHELSYSLPAARELGNKHVIGNLLLSESQLLRLQGRSADAKESHAAASACFREMGMLREIAHAELEAILIDASIDPSGERIAKVITYQTDVGDPRPLPLAWRLESERLRGLGDLESAALALEQSSLVAAALGNPDRIWPVHLEASNLALVAGDPTAAGRELRRALEINRDLSLHFPAGAERERFLSRPDRAEVLTKLRALTD